MQVRFNYFATPLGIILMGLVFGGLAVWLQQAGNPGNMGICIVGYNLADAIGLQNAPIMQYLRPEIPGMVLGAFFAVMLVAEFLPRRVMWILRGFIRGCLTRLLRADVPAPFRFIYV